MKKENFKVKHKETGEILTAVKLEKPDYWVCRTPEGLNITYHISDIEEVIEKEQEINKIQVLDILNSSNNNAITKEKELDSKEPESEEEASNKIINLDTHRIMAQQRAIYVQEAYEDMQKMLQRKSTETMPANLKNEYTKVLGVMESILSKEGKESIRNE